MNQPTTETAQHTPGPWRVVPNTDTKCSEVAFIESKTWNIAGAYPYCSANGYGGEEESLANARLLAAAPEMLDALRAVMTAWQYEANQGDGIMEEHGGVFDSALRTIAKATGTAPESPSDG